MSDNACTKKMTALIAGPKGGVGKTTFALNVSIALAKAGQRTLLVDTDFAMSHVPLFYGEDYHTSYAEFTEFNIATMSKHGPSGISILPAPRFKPTENDMIYNYSYRLMDSLAKTEEFDAIIIDSAPGFSRSHLLFLERSDFTILLTTPEPPSLNAAYAFIKMAAENGLRSKIKLLVNQAVSEDEGNDVYHRFAMAVSYFLERTVSHFGIIPEDNKVLESTKSETPLLIKFPEAGASQAIENIARRFAA
jgi:flagellar biosynthesis protein FlhG